MGEEKPSIALALTERAQKDNIAIRQKSEDLDKILQEYCNILLQLRPRLSLRWVPATPAPAIASRGAIRSELNIQILDSTSAERLTLYLKSELAVFLESPNPEGFVGLIVHLFGWNTDFLGGGTSKVAALLAGNGIVIRPTLAGDEIHAIPDDMLDWQSKEIYAIFGSLLTSVGRSIESGTTVSKWPTRVKAAWRLLGANGDPSDCILSQLTTDVARCVSTTMTRMAHLRVAVFRWVFDGSKASTYPARL